MKTCRRCGISLPSAYIAMDVCYMCAKKAQSERVSDDLLRKKMRTVDKTGRMMTWVPEELYLKLLKEVEDAKQEGSTECETGGSESVRDSGSNGESR